MKHLAAGGFRDLTRIAEADSLMWTSVLLSNPEITIDRIENFKKQLDEIALKIANKDSAAIEHFFEQGKKIRQAMEIHPETQPAFFSLVVKLIVVPVPERLPPSYLGALCLKLSQWFFAVTC